MSVTVVLSWIVTGAEIELPAGSRDTAGQLQLCSSGARAVPTTFIYRHIAYLQRAWPAGYLAVPSVSWPFIYKARLPIASPHELDRRRALLKVLKL
jgi:hypothetical protein